jgi:hypothetical protein
MDTPRGATLLCRTPIHNPDAAHNRLENQNSMNSHVLQFKLQHDTLALKYPDGGAVKIQRKAFVRGTNQGASVDCAGEHEREIACKTLVAHLDWRMLAG